MALAQLGAAAELHEAAQALVRWQPDFSIAFARQKLFYLKRQDQVDLYLEGLRRAGIPPA